MMNLRSSASYTGATEETSVELDSPGAMQTASLAFRTFNQGLGDFGNSLVIYGRHEGVGRTFYSRHIESISMCSESRRESPVEGGIALRPWVHPRCGLLLTNLTFATLQTALISVDDT